MKVAIPHLALFAGTAYITLSSAYTATTYIGGACALQNSVQSMFQITGFNLSAGGSTGCVAPFTGVPGIKWESISMTGCFETGFTEVFSDAACKDPILGFSANAECQELLSFLSFQITGC